MASLVIIIPLLLTLLAFGYIHQIAKDLRRLAETMERIEGRFAHEPFASTSTPPGPELPRPSGQ